jgi:hypothetical protein
MSQFASLPGQLGLQDLTLLPNSGHDESEYLCADPHIASGEDAGPTFPSMARTRRTSDTRVIISVYLFRIFTADSWSIQHGTFAQMFRCWAVSAEDPGHMGEAPVRQRQRGTV